MHKSLKLSTLLLDLGIVSPRSAIGFCLHDSVPQSILKEDLSSKWLNLSISLDCDPLSIALRHL